MRLSDLTILPILSACAVAALLLAISFILVVWLAKKQWLPRSRLDPMIHYAIYLDRRYFHLFYKPPSADRKRPPRWLPPDSAPSPRGSQAPSVQVDIERLISALHAPDPKDRTDASRALAGIGSAASSRLIALLEDNRSDVSVEAGLTLGAIQDRAIVPQLLELSRDENDWVRRGSIIALGGIGDLSACPRLMDALDDANPDVQNDAAEALREIHDPATIPALAQALANSGGAFNFAGIALASFRERALPYLIEAIRKGYDHEMMDIAMQDIGKPAVQPLMDLLNDPTLPWYVAPKAASLLGKIGDHSAIPGLKDALHSKGEDSLIESAASSLAAMKVEAAQQALLQALTLEDPRVRGIVAYVLRDVGGDSVVEALVPLLSDHRRVWESAQMKPTRVSDMAAQSLKAIGTDRALQALRLYDRDDT